MKIFDSKSIIKLILENKNRYVRLAALDLAKDFARASASGLMPEICESGEGMIIEENTRPDIDPIEDESFSVVCDGERIVISAPTYLGTLWGIYTFSEKILGISPTILWDDIVPKKRESIDVEPFVISDKPKGFGFRGVFINDEDLLTGWKESGGVRDIDYPFYRETVDVSVMDRVVETALRMRINLIIPASFLDLANPPERALADVVAKRGIYLSQHHLEPVGVSAFTFEKYLEKHKKRGLFSYIENPDLMEEVWRHYALLWARYDNVIWQIGLRGKLDRPVWEEETPTVEELRRYAEFISSAVGRQKEFIEEATGGKAKHFTCTLWMEGAKLAKQGFLTHPEGVISVFADNGPNQMYANDFYEVKREDGRDYGVYYHVQYFDIGPHLAPLTGLDKLYYNLKLAYDKGDRAYIILNSSNIREFTFELVAYSHMVWDFEGFSKEQYLDEYASRFVAEKDAIKSAINGYYDAITALDISFLDNHHGNYFDFRYEEVEGVKNLMIKDGMVVNLCRHIIGCFKKVCAPPLWDAYYRAITEAPTRFDRVQSQFEYIAKDLPENTRGGVLWHWAVYAKTMSGLYEAMCRLYEAKKAWDRNEKSQSVSSLLKAADEVRNILKYRKCAEIGDFENWYRGERKLDLPGLLCEIEENIEDITKEQVVL